MRVKSLSLQNFRLFGDETQSISFDRSKNITILLGDNGAGKTSILDSLALCLAPYLDAIPNESFKARSKTFAPSDVHLSGPDVRAPFAFIESKILDDSEDIIEVRRVRKGYGDKTQESNVKELKNYGLSLFEKDKLQKNNANSNRNEVVLPIIAYYGTGRGQIVVPERKRNFTKAYNRWDCYAGALLAATDFKRFLAVFDLMEDEERRKKIELKNLNYKSTSLASIKLAINKVVGDRYENPRIELHPLRFVVNDKNTGVESRIEQMSDGFKMIIAMVADIATRMAEANPDMDDPLNTPGIVLIDEIDLHLHPSWQRKILGQLKEVFPNVQFIVSTHSPSIVLGAADIAQVITLKNGKITNNDLDFTYYDVSQILLSSLFGEVAVRTPECERMFKRRDELLLKGESITSEEKLELDDLDNKVSRYAYAESINSIKLKDELHELLTRISGLHAENH